MLTLFMKRVYIFILTIALSACQSVSPSTPPTLPPMRVEQASPAAGQQGAANNGAVENGRPLAARVNSQPIYLDVYQQQVAQLEQALQAQGLDSSTPQGQATLAQVQQQVLNALIDQLIIERAANRLGITITDAMLEARMQESIAQKPGQTQLEQWLAANNLTYEQFKQTVRSQLIANQVFEQITKDTPDAAEQVQIRQIVVADEGAARAIIEQIKNGADFAALAEQYSLDQGSRANGGYIDWFPQGLGLVPPEVEKVAFTLQPGQAHGPIQSPLGWHIIQLQQREPSRPLGDKQQALKQQIFIKWLTEQRSLTTIEIYVGS
jgi:parvulin-like peptidyl-prolyl isomerase